MLSLLGPLFTVVSSVFMLKEHTTRRQKQLLALAIVGMLLVVKPSWNFARLFPMLMGLLAAATVGYAFTLVRLMQLQGEDSGVLVFWFSLLSSLFMLPLTLRDTFVFAWKPFLLVIGSGIAGSALQLFSTQAYGMAPAGTLSVYEYTQLPFAAVLGWLILSEVPSLSSFPGYLITITVSVLVFRSGK